MSRLAVKARSTERYTWAQALLSGLRDESLGIDFSRLNQGSVADTALDPSRIFSALPQRAYSYLRDVQGQVLEGWYGRREERDVVVKMNTGAGKTVVGLLLLKSCQNSAVGPAVYLAADPYLADQALMEAGKLGLEVTSEPNSPRFAAGRCTLVTTIHKLVNGRSVFGVGSVPRIRIGAIVVDDAHACSASVEEQFCIILRRDHEGWRTLFKLFEDDLRRQSGPATLGISDGDPRQLLEVPFWAWQEQLNRVSSTLYSFREEDEFGFHWPLIADSLGSCRAIFTGGELQIVPPCVPIRKIPSFINATRRVFMTATLPDDGVLVEDFGADPAMVAKPVTPSSAGDLGDRMILVPQETHPEMSEDDVRSLVSEVAREHNAVVIVPSLRRAEVWRSYAAMVLTKQNLQEGIRRLTDEHVGLVVLVNRYDGVDLPDDACRLLVIDGVPEAYSPLDRLEAAALSTDGPMTRRQIQRIEQGIGRGVRSNEDFCAVLLLGVRLAQHLHAPGAKERFSPGTRAQMSLSDRLAEELHGGPVEALRQAIRACLGRDAGWVSASRNAVAGAEYPESVAISQSTARRRSAFDLASVGQDAEAAAQLRSITDSIVEPRERGWIKLEAAAYLNRSDRAAAQQLLLSAVRDNPALTKPISGIDYQRMAQSSMSQAARCVGFLSRYATPNDVLLAFESMLASLEFRADGSEEFEAAMKALALLIGFDAQRPDKEFGAGPDVLWQVSELQFCVIECKSEATEDIPKKDASQLSNSLDWFQEKYPTSCTASPVVVHATGKLRQGVVVPKEARVLDEPGLARLKQALRSFAVASSKDYHYKSLKETHTQLAAADLVGSSVIGHYTTPIKAW